MYSNNKIGRSQIEAWRHQTMRYRWWWYFAQMNDPNFSYLIHRTKRPSNTLFCMYNLRRNFILINFFFIWRNQIFSKKIKLEKSVFFFHFFFLIFHLQIIWIFMRSNYFLCDNIHHSVYIFFDFLWIFKMCLFWFPTAKS